MGHSLKARAVYLRNLAEVGEQTLLTVRNGEVVIPSADRGQDIPTVHTRNFKRFQVAHIRGTGLQLIGLLCPPTHPSQGAEVSLIQRKTLALFPQANAQSVSNDHFFAQSS